MESPEEFEIVDSSAMRVLGHFDCSIPDEEAMSCNLKTDGHWIVFTLCSRLGAESVGYLAIEQGSLGPIKTNLADVLAGKLRDSAIDCVTFTSGNDQMQISASYVFPGNRATPRETITIMNLRELELDGLEYSTGLSLSPDAAVNMLAALQDALDRC
jgi:hypothetical protein